MGVWECEFSNCGSVPKNKWECGSVSFQISGSVAKNEWECGSGSFQIGGSVPGVGVGVWPVWECDRCGSGSVASVGVEVWPIVS